MCTYENVQVFYEIKPFSTETQTLRPYKYQYIVRKFLYYHNTSENLVEAVTNDAKQILEINKQTIISITVSTGLASKFKCGDQTDAHSIHTCNFSSHNLVLIFTVIRLLSNAFQPPVLW